MESTGRVSITVIFFPNDNLRPLIQSGTTKYDSWEAPLNLLTALLSTERMLPYIPGEKKEEPVEELKAD